jgi:hypothetical protein
MARDLGAGVGLPFRSGHRHDQTIEQWRRVEHASRTSLKDLLLAPEARTENLASRRGEHRRRTRLAFD